MLKAQKSSRQAAVELLVERLAAAHRQGRELGDRLRAAAPHLGRSVLGTAGTVPDRTWGEGPGQRGARALAAAAAVAGSGAQAGGARRALSGSRRGQRPSTSEAAALQPGRRPPLESSSSSASSSSSSAASSPASSPPRHSAPAVFRGASSGKLATRPGSSAAPRSRPFSAAEAGRSASLYGPVGCGNRGPEPWSASEAALAEINPQFAALWRAVQPLGGWGEVGDKLQLAAERAALERCLFHEPLEKLVRAAAERFHATLCPAAAGCVAVTKHVAPRLTSACAASAGPVSPSRQSGRACDGRSSLLRRKWALLNVSCVSISADRALLRPPERLRAVWVPAQRTAMPRCSQRRRGGPWRARVREHPRVPQQAAGACDGPAEGRALL